MRGIRRLPTPDDNETESPFVVNPDEICNPLYQNK